MSVQEHDRDVDDLSAELLEYLERELESARNLLKIVRGQSGAIREQGAPEVVRLAGDLQAELHRRELLDITRERLTEHAAQRLGVSPGAVTIAEIALLLEAEAGHVAVARTEQLVELLTEIQNEHEINRALMQQELAFLDHLLRLTGSAGGYDSAGERVSKRKPTPLMRQSVFDLEA